MIITAIKVKSYRFKNCFKIIKDNKENLVFRDDFEKLIFYKLRTIDKNKLKNISDVVEGLENRIIEKALNNRVGVESAEVDLNKEEAFVKYDPEQLTLEDLIKEDLKQIIESEKITKIIAVDGGANKARDLKLLPDLIIGDLDSITEKNKEYYSGC